LNIYFTAGFDAFYRENGEATNCSF